MRKTKTVTVHIKGRDEGKQFLLTEMPASRIEKWAARALLAVAHSGVEVPEEVTGAGMAALAVVGLRALSGVSFAEAEPLLDEMMGCVQIIPDPAHPAIVRRLSPDEFGHRRGDDLCLPAWGGVRAAYGFFHSRRDPETSVGFGASSFLGYPNLTQAIGTVISSRLATLRELDTVYGLEDLYTLLEILAVDAHNQQVASKAKD